MARPPRPSIGRGSTGPAGPPPPSSAARPLVPTADGCAARAPPPALASRVAPPPGCAPPESPGGRGGWRGGGRGSPGRPSGGRRSRRPGFPRRSPCPAPPFLKGEPLADVVGHPRRSVRVRLDDVNGAAVV